MLKNEKRYFIREGIGEDTVEKTLIIADVEDIVEKIELAGLVYVDRANIDNIEEYGIEDIDSDTNGDAKDMEDYVFMTIEDFTQDEKYFLERNWIRLDRLEKFEDVDIDTLTDEEIERLERETEKELSQSIIEKMKAKGEDIRNMETYKAWGYFDGSNWKEYPIEHWYYTEWVDYTEELEGMKEIDRSNYNTGHKELFELVDGQIILIDTSYYQGSLWGIVFLDEDAETVEDAEKTIYQNNSYY